LALFYLVRHADIVWGPGNPGLSALGRVQAAAVGKYLRSRLVAQIYASPLRRARQTAAIIARSVDAPVTVDPRLRERMNWGDVVAQSWAEFEAEWERASRDRDYIPLGGMSVRQAAAQLDAFLKDLARRYPQASLAAVTHAGILSDFLSEYFRPAELNRLSPAWKLHQSEAITHCSITTLRLEFSQSSGDGTGSSLPDLPGHMRLEDLAVVVSPR
jgi:broad specificity phosphatase PhoE